MSGVDGVGELGGGVAFHPKSAQREEKPSGRERNSRHSDGESKSRSIERDEGGAELALRVCSSGVGVRTVEDVLVDRLDAFAREDELGLSTTSVGAGSKARR